MDRTSIATTEKDPGVAGTKALDPCQSALRAAGARDAFSFAKPSLRVCYLPWTELGDGDTRTVRRCLTLQPPS